MIKPKQFLIFFAIISFVFTGCGSKEDEIERSLKKARIYLSTSDCDAAISELDETGRENKNSDYLKVLASAYACKAGFNEPNFFGNDLPLMGTDNSNFFNSLTIFSTSNATSSLSTSYIYLQLAIDTLLYAGDLNEVSHINRASVFGESEIRNIDSQSIYMIIAQIGNYLHLYGNTDSLGNKGSGDTNSTNDCISDYTTTNSQAARAAATGAGQLLPCSSDTDGHPELATATPGRKAKLCQGIILFNNLTDIFSNISFSGANSETLDDLNLTDDCASAGLGAVCTVKTQELCETIISVEDIELFFLTVFESNLNG